MPRNQGQTTISHYGKTILLEPKTWPDAPQQFPIRLYTDSINLCRLTWQHRVFGWDNRLHCCLTSKIIPAKQMTESTFSIGLTNPKSPVNVGLVMRAAGCFGVDSVFYTGERYDRAAPFNTDTHNASLSIPLTWVPSLPGDFADNTQVVCVELVEGATPLTTFQHPDNALYIFGPEDGSIHQKVIDRADSVVFIPTIGSLNLAAAVNVLLYDRLAKMPASVCYDALIRESRDANNRAKVKSR